MKSSTSSLQDRINLTYSAFSIPRLGFGVYKIRGQTCVDAVIEALSAGYRHIDSAQLYRNEHLVRSAIQSSHVPRQDIFLTTKIGGPGSRSDGSAEAVYADAVESVNRIAGEDGYVDLVLIHNPGPSREHREVLWAALEKLQVQGRTHSIGVSNFRQRHVEEMKEYSTSWPPSVNQIEVSRSLPTMR